MPTTPPRTTTRDRIEQLWIAHRGQARTYVTKRAGTPADHAAIEDALNAAAEIFSRTLLAGEEIHTPAGWLCTVAWRQYVEILEAARRERNAWAQTATVADNDEDPLLSALTGRECGEHLERTLTAATDTLTEHQRRIVSGFYEGLSYDELAERYGVSWGSVSKALTRARAKLAGDEDLREAFTDWTGR